MKHEAAITCKLCLSESNEEYLNDWGVDLCRMSSPDTTMQQELDAFKMIRHLMPRWKYEYVEEHHVQAHIDSLVQLYEESEECAPLCIAVKARTGHGACSRCVKTRALYKVLGQNLVDYLFETHGIDIWIDTADLPSDNSDAMLV